MKKKKKKTNKKKPFADLVKDAKSVAGFSPFCQFGLDKMMSQKHGLATKYSFIMVAS